MTTLTELLDMAYKIGYADCLADREDAQRMPLVNPEQRAELITEICCRYFNMDVDTMCVRSRLRKVLYPRQVTMYLLSAHSGLSLTSIGKHFFLDHTTAIHSRNQIIKHIQTSEQIKAEVTRLEEWIDAAMLSHAVGEITPSRPRIYKPKAKPKPIKPVERKLMVVKPHDNKRVPIIRPVATYSNRSPYGIASQMNR